MIHFTITCFNASAILIECISCSYHKHNQNMHCMLRQCLLHHNCQQCVCAHVSTYLSWWIGAYLAAKQPRHEVRVSTWLGEAVHYRENHRNTDPKLIFHPKMAISATPVSYTHLTLPTIYSV